MSMRLCKEIDATDTGILIKIYFPPSCPCSLLKVVSSARDVMGMFLYFDQMREASVQ